MTILGCSVIFAVFARFRPRIAYRAILLDHSRAVAVGNLKEESAVYQSSRV